MRRLAFPTLLLALAGVAAAQHTQEDPQAQARKTARRSLDQLGRRALAGGRRGAQDIAAFTRQLQREASKHGPTFSGPVAEHWATQARDQRADQLRRLHAAIKPDDRLRKKLRAELIRRRRHALGLIHSKSSYRKGSRKAQQEVDRRVALVREVWDHPTRALGALQSRIKTMFKKFDAAGALLVALSSQIGAEQDTAMAALTATFDKALGVRTFGYNDADQTRIDTCTQLMQSNAEASTSGSKDERALVRLTNEYRVMMGLEPLRLDDRLMTCARRHSEYMHKTRRFAHVDRRHTDGATPLLRARKAGYQDLVGENILMGAEMHTPARALDGWRHSAGHHRNILMPKYQSLGTGRAGAFWTQVFGHS